MEPREREAHRLQVGLADAGVHSAGWHLPIGRWRVRGEDGSASERAAYCAVGRHPVNSNKATWGS